MLTQRALLVRSISSTSSVNRPTKLVTALGRVDGAGPDGGGRKGTGQVRVLKREYLFWDAQPLQCMDTERAHRDVMGLVAQQHRGARRGEDLAAVRQGAQARAADDRRAGVVLRVADAGLAGVHRHPDRDRAQRGPGLVQQCALRLDRGGDREGGTREHRDHAVALALLDGPDAAVPAYRLVEDRVVAIDRRGHRLRLGLPQRRRFLDVAEQERHGAGRWRRG